MGLDMFLTAKMDVNVEDWYNEEVKAKRIPIAELITFTFDLPKNAKLSSVGFEVGYWRKANQIHQWFVKNVQNGEDDCGSYYVSSEDLTQLRDLCSELLVNKNIEEAEQKLPTAAGFFFGSVEYDEWYWVELEQTVEICNTALKMIEKNAWIYYQSSW